MRIVAWNMKSARSSSAAWSYLRELSPDIALLQEVGSVPEHIARSHYRTKIPVKKSGAPQSFQTVLLAHGGAGEEFKFASQREWVNAELDRFDGNIVGGKLSGRESTVAPLWVVSAYCPPWPLSRDRLLHEDTKGVQLEHNDDVWLPDLIWYALRGRASLESEAWIVGGDFNSAPTFDDGPRGNRGNREWLGRMREIGLVDCLAETAGRPTPTFRHSRGAARHQIDHLFASPSMLKRLRACRVTPADEIWRSDGMLSDHLPIIADFADT